MNPTTSLDPFLWAVIRFCCAWYCHDHVARRFTGTWLKIFHRNTAWNTNKTPNKQVAILLGFWINASTQMRGFPQKHHELSLQKSHKLCGFSLGGESVTQAKFCIAPNGFLRNTNLEPQISPFSIANWCPLQPQLVPPPWADASATSDASGKLMAFLRETKALWRDSWYHPYCWWKKSQTTIWDV